MTFLGGPLDGEDRDIKVDMKQPFMVFHCVAAELEIFALYHYNEGKLHYVRSKTREQMSFIKA